MSRMHADEADVDADLVHRLLREQFPRWAGLEVRRLDSGGTVNAIFRVGDELTARLPLTAGGTSGLHREARWLPVLASAVPVPVPTVEAIGAPGEGYPWEWAVHRWIEGSVLVEGRVGSSVARSLGEVVVALRGVDVAGAPAAHRSGTLADVDTEVREAVESLRRSDEPFDAAAVLAAWDRALAVPAWAAAPCWIHSDLMPSNLLSVDGGLAAVIDFSTSGLGDPAVDLIPAWNLLPLAARRDFREHADVDEDTWARGCGWALSMALVQLPYYRSSNPVISANARYVIERVLAPDVMELPR